MSYSDITPTPLLSAKTGAQRLRSKDLLEATKRKKQGEEKMKKASKGGNDREEGRRKQREKGEKSQLEISRFTPSVTTKNTNAT